MKKPSPDLFYINNILEKQLKPLRRCCPEDITDRVFLAIQDKYLKSYLRDFQNYGKDVLNKTIGKKIKRLWSLKNLERDYNPKSYLIKSFTKHKNT
jgi:hypothetical protein